MSHTQLSVAMSACVWLCIAVLTVHLHAATAYTPTVTDDQRLAQSSSYYYANGSLEWVANIGSAVEDVGWGVTHSDELQAAFFCGYFSRTIEIGNTAVQEVTRVTALGLQDGYLIATSQDDGRALWVQTVRGEFDDSVRGVQMVPGHGSLVAVGYFTDTATFGAASAGGSVVTLETDEVPGSTDAFVAKYNASTGALLWVVRAGGGLWDSAVGVVIAFPSQYQPHHLAITYGYFQSARLRVFSCPYNASGIAEADRSNCSGLAEPMYNTGHDPAHDSYAFAVTLEHGDVVWQSRYGGAGTDIPNAADLTSSHEQLLIGGSLGSTGLSDVRSDEPAGAAALTAMNISSTLDGLMVSLNTSDGSMLWQYRFGGSKDEALLGLKVVRDHVVIGGYFDSLQLTLGNETMVNRGSLDAYLAYIDLTDMTVRWAWAIASGPSQQLIFSIAVNGRLDRVIVGGFIRGTTRLMQVDEWKEVETLGMLSSDMLLAEVALSDGMIVWRAEMGGVLNDQLLAVDASPVRVFFTGFQRSTVTYGGRKEWEPEVTLVSVGDTDAVIGSLGDVTPPLVTISTDTVLTNTTLLVRVQFSEYSIGFQEDDVELSSGRATDFVVLQNGTQYTFKVRDMDEGLVTVGLRVGAVHDPAGNVNLQPPEPFTITFDSVIPTVQLESHLWDPTSADVIPITATFSECVAGFSLDDVNLSSGVIGELRPQNECKREEPWVVEMKILGMTPGNFSCNISTWAVADLAGNGNMNIATYEIVIDKTPPQVAFSSQAPDPTRFNITVTATFDVRVLGFEAEDIVTSSGSIINFVQISPLRYRFLLVNLAQGVTFLNIPSNIALDDAGNGNSRAPEFGTAVFDSVPPWLELTTDSPEVTNQDITVTATWSEAVVGFSPADIQFSSGVLQGWIDLFNQTLFTFTITEPEDGEMIITVPASAATDIAGNPSTLSTTLRGIYVDRTPPITLISSPNPDPTNATIVLLVEFNERISSFDLAWVDVSSGDVSNLRLLEYTVTRTLYRCTVTNMAQGPFTVDIANVTTDLALNWNIPAPQLRRHYDTEPPVVTLASPTPSPTLNPILVIIQFNEYLDDFEIDDLVPSSGRLVNLTTVQTGWRYTCFLVAMSEGVSTIELRERSVHDTAGNGNRGMVSVDTPVFDSIGANVSLTTQDIGPVNGDITLLATFSETVTGFTAEDVVLSSGVVVAVQRVEVYNPCEVEYAWLEPTAWSFRIHGADDGFPTAFVRAGAVIDLAGNPSFASPQRWQAVERDTVSPNVTLSSAVMGRTFGEPTLKMTVTFSEFVTPIALSDVVLSSGWPSFLETVTHPSFAEDYESLFPASASTGNSSAGRGYSYPFDSNGSLVPALSLGYSVFTFVINDADNDRLVVNFKAGAGKDAAGNPSLPAAPYTRYKWSGWLTAIGIEQGIATLCIHGVAIVMLLAVWQIRYMRLRYLGRVTVGNVLEDHEQAKLDEERAKAKAARAAKRKAKEKKNRKKKKRLRRQGKKKGKAGGGGGGGGGARPRAGSRKVTPVNSDDEDGGSSGGSSSEDEESWQRRQEKLKRSARRSVQQILAATSFKCSSCGFENVVPADQVQVPEDLIIEESDSDDSDGSQKKPALNVHFEEDSKHGPGEEGGEDGAAAEAGEGGEEGSSEQAEAPPANAAGILSRHRSSQRIRERARMLARRRQWQSSVDKVTEEDEAAKRLEVIKHIQAEMAAKAAEDKDAEAKREAEASPRGAAAGADGRVRLKPLVSMRSWRGSKPKPFASRLEAVLPASKSPEKADGSSAFPSAQQPPAEAPASPLLGER